MIDSNNARSGICCGGTWVIDSVKMISCWPRQDELAYILNQEEGAGGSAYNVLMDLARFQLGIPLEGLGLVGQDEGGARVLRECKERGIDARFVVSTDAAPTAYTDVMTVEGTGRRTFFHHRGANALLAPEHFPFQEFSSRLFLLAYLLLLDTLDQADEEFGTVAARVLAGLRAVGIETVIDLVSEDSDRFASVVHPALPYTDYCIVNELEAGRTVGLDLRPGGKLNAEVMEEAAAALLELGVRKVAVIHAPELSVALAKDGQALRQPSHRLPEGFIQGTVGAGDAFLAGVIAGVHEGWDLSRCLRFATAAAASCLRHPTTTAGVGTAAEIWELADRLPLQ